MQALKLILSPQALATIPRARAEWLLWVDMDVLLVDMAFNMPLNKYLGQDLVLWGNAQHLAAGDLYRGPVPARHCSQSSLHICSTVATL